MMMMKLCATSMVLTKTSKTNFVKAVETLHGRLVVVVVFEIDIYNLFKHFIDIVSNSHEMLERRHKPSISTILPLTYCLVGVMNFLTRS